MRTLYEDYSQCFRYEPISEPDRSTVLKIASVPVGHTASTRAVWVGSGDRVAVGCSEGATNVTIILACVRICNELWISAMFLERLKASSFPRLATSCVPVRVHSKGPWQFDFNLASLNLG